VTLRPSRPTLGIAPFEIAILKPVSFRDRLLGTLRAVQPVLETPGVMVVGSEVPNLLEPKASSTLVVSEDVDLAVPIEQVREVKVRLREVKGFRPSSEEPSVWLPDDQELLEVNFLGLDRKTRDTSDTYIFEDPELPLLVFGLLSLLEPGPSVEVEGLRVPVPRPAGLLLEKLATERSGEKGDRDLLVALGLLLIGTPADMDELEEGHRRLRSELRRTVLSNLTLLSLLPARLGMPDPEPHRQSVHDLRRRLERQGGAT
jgi:hypothetical protein